MANYTGPANAQRQFPRKHDTVYWYSAGDKWTFQRDRVRVPYVKLQTGKTHGIFKEERELSKAGKVPEDWWTKFTPVARIQRERVGYPTQKPLALLDRIIKASSNPGDVVLDPFCGCATACVSAESLGREWIGIDLSPVAATLVESRLRDQFGIFAEIHHRTDIPRRADLGDLPNYRTHRHELFGKQEGHCCGCRMMFPFRNFEIDHVIPRAKGGSDHVDNLQLLCGACNRAKGTGTQAELIAKLKERGQSGSVGVPQEPHVPGASKPGRLWDRT